MLFTVGSRTALCHKRIAALSVFCIIPAMHHSEPVPHVDDPMDLLRRAQFFFEGLPPMMVDGAEHSIRMPEVLEAIRNDFDLCVKECQHGLANSAGEERHGYELVVQYLEVQWEWFKALLVSEVCSVSS